MLKASVPAKPLVRDYGAVKKAVADRLDADGYDDGADPTCHLKFWVAVRHYSDAQSRWWGSL